MLQKNKTATDIWNSVIDAERTGRRGFGRSEDERPGLDGRHGRRFDDLGAQRRRRPLRRALPGGQSKKKKNPTNQQSGNAIENEFRFKNERSDLDERWTGGAGETEAAAAATVGGVAGLATAAAGGVAGPGGHTGRANFCGWA